ncbi:hypothetical protein [Nostoc sp. ChiQUE01b]|uniref:hypothetical protein n=1 Tax=Nostoc sp. ChiQUE01b TaxID=3075376 RepID=UPI002AD316EF|nr:hypothetical protein [Nostoc sp. ChiQUE01b]MDZ8257662.1 hypothetical protein [Nostoc sp. ChiQUE01b]
MFFQPFLNSLLQCRCLGYFQLAWLSGEQKGELWKVNQLNFYCALDTRMLTNEGTQQVIEEKVTKITKILVKQKQKDDLNAQQQASITRQQSTLDRIDVQ